MVEGVRNKERFQSLLCSKGMGAQLSVQEGEGGCEKPGWVLGSALLPGHLSVSISKPISPSKLRQQGWVLESLHPSVPQPGALK